MVSNYPVSYQKKENTEEAYVYCKQESPDKRDFAGPGKDSFENKNMNQSKNKYANLVYIEIVN